MPNWKGGGDPGKAGKMPIPVPLLGFFISRSTNKSKPSAKELNTGLSQVPPIERSSAPSPEGPGRPPPEEPPQTPC